MRRRAGADRRHRAAGPALAGLVLLIAAGCTSWRDAEQAHLCRTALPALNPDGVRLELARVEPGLEPRTLRIDYTAMAEGRPPLERWILCRFAGEGLSAGKAELTGIVTESGPLAAANLHFLRRFYLETPEGLAGDPGPPRATLAEVPEMLAVLAQHLLVSLPRTAIYGLLAAAYALVFGLAGRINLAFGELAAVGAAATVAGAALVLSAGISAPLAGLGAGLLWAAAAGALYGAVGGHFTVRRIRSASPQPSLIATVGLSLALMEYLRLAQSPVPVWLPPVWSEAWPLLKSSSFVVGVTPLALVTTATGLAAACAVLWLMRASGFGRAWRAYADDPAAATLCGVDGPRLLLVTLALSGAMAGLAGMLIVAQYGGLGFADGFQFGLKALIGAVIGGIGSVSGAWIGGCLIAGFETLWSAFMPIEARDIALYAVLVAFLVARPGGIFGLRQVSPRTV